MRFGILGALTVGTAGGRPVTVPGRKVRMLLADLLVHEGRPVSADRLVDDLWGDAPPRKPARALHTTVWQLRRSLEQGETGAGSLVVSRPPGYALEAAADDVDARRFERLLAEARRADAPQARLALLRDALALWRGPVLADAGFARPVIARLEEARLTAVEGPRRGDAGARRARLAGGRTGRPARTASAPGPLHEHVRDACVRRFGMPPVNVYGSSDGVNCHTGRDPGRWAPGLVGVPDPAVAEISIRDPEGPLPEAEFDLVHARLVLRLLPERLAVLDRLVRALKPGGVLQIDEFDATDAPALSVPDPAAHDLYRAFLDAKARIMTAANVDVAWGRKAARAMREAGLTGVCAHRRYETWHAGSPGMELLSHHTRHLRDEFVRAGMTDGQPAEVRALLAHPGFRVRSYAIYSVQGRRPGEGRGPPSASTWTPPPRTSTPRWPASPGPRARTSTRCWPNSSASGSPR